VKRAVALGAAVATLATVGIGVGLGTGSATAAQPKAAPGTAAPAGSLTWGSCPTGYPETLQCATRTPAQRQGVLLVNPGGPGGEGVGLAGFVQRALPVQLQQAYDVIGFDPRGVGLSQAIRCVDPAKFYRYPALDPVPAKPRDLISNTAVAAKYSASCVRTIGAGVRHYNTVNTVRDMDRIRAALGEKQINYLGYSYGTALGSVYASMFPAQTRRFILDSAIDPGGIWYEANLGQNVQFDVVFQEFLAWVAQHNALYKLGATPQQVKTAYYRTRAALKTKPAGGKVGPNEFDNIYVGAMYGDSAWPGVAAALSAYVTGKNEAQLLEEFTPADAEAENGTTVYTVVGCNDKAWPRNLTRWYADASRQYKKYPFMVWGNTWLNLPCAFWPFSSPVAPPIGGAKVPAVLVLNSTGDPATPYAGAVNMHKRLPGSRLLTVTKNTNHGQYLFEDNDCVDRYGTAFLLSGKLPAGNVSCVGNPHPTPKPAAPSIASVQRDRDLLPEELRPKVRH
jgi:pimeloyl-ACP methyl ester carboxylesterase